MCPPPPEDGGHPPDARRAKGSNLIPLVKILRSALKKGTVSGLSEQETEWLEETYLPSEWYPFARFEVLLETVHRRILGGSIEAARGMGESVAETTLNDVYRAFLFDGRPEVTVERLTRIWPIYFDFGRLAVEPAEGGTRVVITGYENAGRTHGNVLLGWLGRAVQLSGGALDELEFEKAPWRGEGQLVLRLVWHLAGKEG